MNSKKKQPVRLWLIAAIVVVLGTIGSGFYHNLSATAEEAYEGLKLFSDVIELVEKNYVDAVNPKELVEKAIQGMVHSLDPHSSLLLPDELKELQVDTQGEFTGIGISITMRDGFVTVISPIEGTPAYKAGIKAGDKVIKVDGEPTSDLREAVKKIRGPKGTEVVVTIVRKGLKEPLDIKLIRDVIPIESVKFLALKPGYGYVWITNFRDSTNSDLVKVLAELEAGGTPLKGLVLDLRDNPGGLLEQAIEVSDTFLETGKILSIEGRSKKNTKIYKAKPSDIPRNYPIVLLINGGSASASEIVAGALQDHKRALILGSTSFGKGSVQTVETLRNGYGLKLTIARYYTPSGRSIQAKGIEPDIFVKQKQIDLADLDEDQRLTKEKDLKNHLEAEPGKGAKKETESKNKPGGDKDKDSVFDTGGSRFGRLELEKLQSDSQVMRALDILLSHDVFKGLKS